MRLPHPNWRLLALVGSIGLGVLAAWTAWPGSDAATDADRSPAVPGSDQNSATLTVAAAGDFGVQAPGAATLEAMAKAEPDLYLALGDFGYAGPTSADRFCGLVSSRLDADAPVEIVSGNHEEDPGEDGRLDEFAQCLPDRLDAVGDYGTQYYFDLGRLARFIMISPDLTIDSVNYYYGGDGEGGDNANLAWLETAIDEARAMGIEWVVVGMHKNCISVGEYYCDVYQDLFSKLIAKRVDLVLSGHDHTYQRSKQINAPRPGCKEVLVDHFDPDCVVDGGDAYRRGAGSVFVVSGTGGAELYPVHADDPEAGYFVATMGKNTAGNRHGFTELKISRERLAVRFVGSTPGSFGDRFEIDAGAGP